MAPTGTPPAAITPQGIRDGDPAVLAALAARRGPAVVAFAETICEPAYVVRAAADAFARFRAAVADPSLDTNVHPDALLLRCARRAALDLAPRGPDLGCGPATDLLAQRAERTIKPADATLLNRHLDTCEHCRDLGQRLDAADRAYREADDQDLDAATVAPMVAALAAAAPVVAPAAVAPPAEQADLTNGRMADQREIPAEEPAEPEPEPEPEEPEPEPDEPAEPEPEPEIPIGTRRVTGAPASYYELPPLPPRERGARAKKAISGAAAAGGMAAGLTKRARKAARDRLRPPSHAAEAPPAAEQPAASAPPFAASPERAAEPPTADPPPADPPLPEPPFAADPQLPEPVLAAPGPESPMTVITDDEYDPLAPDDPELRETAARAAARHYRRLRHRTQRETVMLGGPPRLLRPSRDRGPHLPLSAHGPRDLALPAGLVVIAVLVVMAVSGVFGGGSSTPATGTQASSAPEISMASESWTHLSLADAERIAARTAGTGTTAVTAP